MKRAYVTVLSGGDADAPGVEALGASLRASETRAPTVLMATPDVPPATRARLAMQGWRVRDVDPVRAPSTGVARARSHADPLVTLRAWQLTEFDKVVFLSPDTLVLRNVDELFDRPELSAAPDYLSPQRFEPAVMVLAPSATTFDRMLSIARSAASFEADERSFLNGFFHRWRRQAGSHRLAMGYNLFHFLHRLEGGGRRDPVKILRYAAQKPWRWGVQVTGASSLWWNTYHSVRPETRRSWRRTACSAEDWLYEQLARCIV